MSFSLPRFLRRTPAQSLKAYFAARDLSGFEKIHWDGQPKGLLGSLQKAIDALAEADREERVDQLCDYASRATSGTQFFSQRRRANV